MPAKIVYQADGKTVAFDLSKDIVTIGRSTENDLVINNPMISRHHAKLHRSGETWRVTDLGSSNGTQINELGHTDRDLHNGDRILLHKFAVTFVDDSAPAFSLTPASEPVGLEGGTIFRSAVDFSNLASIAGTETHTVPAAGVDRLQKLLSIVTEVSRVLLTSPSLSRTLASVLDLVFEHLTVDRGCVMLWNEDTQDLVVECVKIKGPDAKQSASEIRFSRTIAERVFREKVAVLTSDAQTDDRFAGGASIVALGIRSAMAAPLWNGDRVEGLIYVDTPLRAKAFDNFDLDLLSALGNHVAVAIEQSRLQTSVMQQQLVRRKLERYHSPAVIDRITRQSDDSSSEDMMADEQIVTVLFADIVGFTSRCENMEPRSVAALLNHYFSEMSEMVFKHDGTLDKFIGDCLMAVFGAPLPMQDHATRAVEAALDMREALDALNEPLAPEARVQFRVGMHSGKVVAGDIGSVRRTDYTVLGSTVNLAARLESSVAQPGQIVITDATLEAIGAAYETVSIGEFQPKGISRAVRCFELIGRRPD